MDQESKSFLKELLSQCGPSGFEQEIQAVWTGRTKKYADKIERDVHGNAIAVVNPKASFRLMLAGHCDEIGFIITHITDEGFLYFAAIGGIDPGVVPGTQLKIRSEKGYVDGIIGKKAIHLMNMKELSEIVPLNKLYIDIGAKDRKDALKYVSIGDPVCVAPNFKELKNGRFSSKACDDRTGAFIVSEVLKYLSKKKAALKVGVYSVSTVQEEVGLRGAETSSYAIAPQAAIAVDVNHATDTPDVDKRISGEVKIGAGPIIQHGPVVNPVLGKLLVATAKKKKIAYQVNSLGRPGGTDTAVIQVARGGVATALISVPNRYMHTPVEVCSYDDIESIVVLIAETILAIKPDMSFIPE